MFIVISIAVFVVVALAVFVGASLLDERSSKARLLRERLSTVQKAGEREPNQELTLLRDEVMSKIPALDNLPRRQRPAVVPGQRRRAGAHCSVVQRLSPIRLAGSAHWRLSSLLVRQLQEV